MPHCAQCIVEISYISWTFLIDAVPLGSGIRNSSFWIECPTVRNVSFTFLILLELSWNARAHGDLLFVHWLFLSCTDFTWNGRAHGVHWLYLRCTDLACALVLESCGYIWDLLKPSETRQRGQREGLGTNKAVSEGKIEASNIGSWKVRPTEKVLNVWVCEDN